MISGIKTEKTNGIEKIPILRSIGTRDQLQPVPAPRRFSQFNSTDHTIIDQNNTNHQNGISSMHGGKLDDEESQVRIFIISLKNLHSNKATKHQAYTCTYI